MRSLALTAAFCRSVPESMAIRVKGLAKTPVAKDAMRDLLNFIFVRLSVLRVVCRGGCPGS